MASKFGSQAKGMGSQMYKEAKGMGSQMYDGAKAKYGPQMQDMYRKMKTDASQPYGQVK